MFVKQLKILLTTPLIHLRLQLGQNSLYKLLQHKQQFPNKKIVKFHNITDKLQTN